MLHDSAIPLHQHPYGVKPLGNAFGIARPPKEALQRLPDELLIEILEYLDAKSLIQAGATCRSLFAFSRFDDLWKTMYIA